MAIDELQLHDLQNMDAATISRSALCTISGVCYDSPAVDVKQKASPARHDDATVPKTPAKGKESSIPILWVREDERMKQA